MLHQVNEHLEHGPGDTRWAAVTTGTSPGPGRGHRREMRPDQRARELRPAVKGQQRRLSQSLRHSTDLLSACADQAGRLVTALEGGKWSKTRASAQSAETVQHKVERARELRKAIIATGMTLAGIAEEVDWIDIDEDREACRPGGVTGYQPVGVAAKRQAPPGKLCARPGTNPRVFGSGQATGPAGTSRAHGSRQPGTDEKNREPSLEVSGPAGQPIRR